MRALEARARINLFLGLALACNLALWAGSHDFYARWAGVPPVPSRSGAVMMTLGDTEFSYRFLALALQQLGDGGGRTTPLKDYDYHKLGQWFDLLDDLDPASEHVPLIVAYYFGAVRVPESVSVVVDYLVRVGQNPVGEKWRWLAEAAFLARHRLNDLHRALDIAYTLSKMQLSEGRELPPWARQLPAFILQAQGEKEAARKLMESILTTEKDLPPQEINFMKGYLVEQLGMKPEEVDAIVKMRGVRK